MASVLPSDITYFGSASMPGFDGSTTITAAITTTTATTASVTANATFPQSGEFPILIDSEILWVTQGASTNSWTFIRGMFGTTAATHLINAAVTSPSGGIIDFLTGVAFTDVGAGDTVDIISSSASDTKQIISVAGRDTAGNFISGKTGTLNGQTAVTGVGSAQTFNRLLYVGLGSGTTLTSAPLTAAATSMTVTSATNFPASGQYYVLMGREVVSVTAGQGTTTWSTIVRAQFGTTATAHQSGDSIYLLPFGDVAVYDHTAVVTGTMQSGSAQSTGTTPAIAKLQSGQGASVGIGQIILTTGGTGPHQVRTIIAVTGYGTDVVAVDRDWDTLTDSTTTYTVNKGWKLPFKMGSGVGSTVLVQLTNIQRFLWGAVADVPGGSTHTYYEKIFAVNQNTTTDLTAANIQVLSNSPALPGSSLLDMAITNSVLNDNFVAANRTTLPTAQGGGALSFVTQPGAISLTANSGALAHSSGAESATNVQGVWLRTTIPAGTAAYNGAADIRTVGNTI